MYCWFNFSRTYSVTALTYSDSWVWALTLHPIAVSMTLKNVKKNNKNILRQLSPQMMSRVQRLVSFWMSISVLSWRQMSSSLRQKIEPCSLKVSKKSSIILKWNAGVSSLLLDFHFAPFIKQDIGMITSNQLPLKLNKSSNTFCSYLSLSEDPSLARDTAVGNQLLYLINEGCWQCP